jgi:PilZ domain
MSNWANGTARGPERARRFAIPMPLRYRRRGEETWHAGKVENISRSGVLFKVETLMDECVPIEMTFQLPVEMGGENAARVFCVGKVIRTVLPFSSDQQPSLAADIQSYQFVPKGRAPEA